jgi:hypothetical protein
MLSWRQGAARLWAAGKRLQRAGIPLKTALAVVWPGRTAPPNERVDMDINDVITQLRKEALRIVGNCHPETVQVLVFAQALTRIPKMIDETEPQEYHLVYEVRVTSLGGGMEWKLISISRPTLEAALNAALTEIKQQVAIPSRYGY